jgi:hypothetical protein
MMWKNFTRDAFVRWDKPVSFPAKSGKNGKIGQNDHAALERGMEECNLRMSKCANKHPNSY